jgi:hypothetical protein
MKRTDVLLDVNWEGRETETGTVIYGWHLGTVCVSESTTEDGKRFEVYVTHHQQNEEGDQVVLHWSVLSTLERAMKRHDDLVRELKELGEFGLFARPFISEDELRKVVK